MSRAAWRWQASAPIMDAAPQSHALTVRRVRVCVLPAHPNGAYTVHFFYRQSSVRSNDTLFLRYRIHIRDRGGTVAIAGKCSARGSRCFSAVAAQVYIGDR